MMIPSEPARSGKHPFPDDFVDPKVKEKDEFGLRVAKAIYYSTMSYGPSLFYNDRHLYQMYIDYALGTQSEDQYKPLLRVDPKQPNETWVGAMRWGIKNYATKRINIAISKVSERIYDPTIDIMDESAADEKLDIRNRVQAYMENIELMKEMEEFIGKSFAPEEIDPELLPMSNDELEVWMQSSFKFKEASYLEKLITHHLDRNRFANIKRQLAFDVFVIGSGILYSGMDANMLPEVYRCNPSDMIVPPTDKEDFSDINFCGQIMRPTIAQFRKMAGASMPEHLIKEIVDKHSTVDPGSYYFRRFDYPYEGYQDQARIEVMRYNYVSYNEMVHVKKTDNFGNRRLQEKEFNYGRTAEQRENFVKKYGSSRELMRNGYYTLYEGFWVTGSDQVFRHGAAKHQQRSRGSLAETAMNYKFFAPNIKNNRVVSTMKQMIPVLDELQAFHIKKQHTVASAIPAGVSIDLTAIRNAQLKWNNKDMSDQDKINFLFQTGVFVHESGDRFVAGSSYSPIKEFKTNQLNEINTYLALIQSSLMELDEIIGYNKVTTASTLRPDTLKGTAEVQERQTEVALDYLYRADRELSLEAVKTIGILTHQSVLSRTDGYYERIIGSHGVKAIRQSPFYDFGYELEMRPMAQEWLQMYQEAMDAVSKGHIGYDDLLDLRSMKNLKEASLVFKQRIRRYKKEASEAEDRKIQATLEGQRMSNVDAHQNQMQLEQVKAEGKLAVADKEIEKMQIQYELMTKYMILEENIKTKGQLKVEDLKGDERIRELLVKDRIYEENELAGLGEKKKL